MKLVRKFWEGRLPSQDPTARCGAGEAEGARRGGAGVAEGATSSGVAHATFRITSGNVAIVGTIALAVAIFALLLSESHSNVVNAFGLIVGIVAAFLAYKACAVTKRRTKGRRRSLAALAVGSLAILSILVNWMGGGSSASGPYRLGYSMGETVFAEATRQGPRDQLDGLAHFMFTGQAPREAGYTDAQYPEFRRGFIKAYDDKFGR